MHNFYKMLHLDSADVPIGEIQKQCKAIAQSGELPLEHVKKIYSVLSNPEKRAKYNAALRQAEPDFFRQPEPLEPVPAAIPTQNFYRLLNLKSADVDERTIQNHFKAAVSRGEIPLETVQQIRDTLFNMGKRSVYNQALRQSDPDFFRTPQTISIDDEETDSIDDEETEAQYRPTSRKSQKVQSDEPSRTAEKGKFIVDNQARNIFVSLFAVALIAVLLPWIKVLDITFAGYQLTWLNPILFAWCAFLVLKANMQDEELEYTKLLIPLAIIVGNYIRFVMRINTKFDQAFLAASNFSYGYGFYLQIVVIVAIFAYLFVCYQKNNAED